MPFRLRIQGSTKKYKKKKSSWVKVLEKKSRTSKEKEDQIIDLLSKGISKKKITKILGISRRVIYRIKHRMEGKQSFTFDAFRSDAQLMACEPKRCPECGGKVVIWPCILCHPNSAYYYGNL